MGYSETFTWVRMTMLYIKVYSGYHEKYVWKKHSSHRYELSLTAELDPLQPILPEQNLLVDGGNPDGPEAVNEVDDDDPFKDIDNAAFFSRRQFEERGPMASGVLTFPVHGGESKRKTSSGLENTLTLSVTAGGTIASINQFRSFRPSFFGLTKHKWFHPGINRWYSFQTLEKIGNVNSISKMNAILNGKAWGVASKGFFWAGIGLSSFLAVDHAMHGEYGKAGLSLLDVGAAYLMTYGGPWGLGIGGAYYVGRYVGPYFYNTYQGYIQSTPKQLLPFYLKYR